MQNGYQIDPLSILLDQMREQGRMLHGLNRTAGRIEQRLEDGNDSFDQVREKLEDHGNRLIVLEQKRDEESSFSTVLEWFERAQRLWPALFLLTSIALAIASSLGVHVPDRVQEFMKHSQTE